jgi:3-oxoacyl-[acyl-carrier protein] reductase/meso-butanediol dehydrogenase/(S,S)-butanediol dehydrogenase/diacetyl reductase
MQKSPATKRTIIVTGGTEGIGAAIARAFHESGCNVIVGARTDNGFANKLGQGTLYCAVDVCQPSQHVDLVQKALDWTGRLDVYVNCAGISAWRSLGRIDEDFWDRMIDTNLKGAFFGCQAAARALNGGGSILSVSSLAGKRGSANNSVYCASKFGLNGLTQALAKELGPKGIRVNAVCPVYVNTPGLLEALKEVESPTQGKNIARFLNNFARENAALRRLPTVEEVAYVCLFLASEKASAITGQCINVDCGVLPQ